jgi:cytochrome c peroxidase
MNLRILSTYALGALLVAGCEAEPDLGIDGFTLGEWVKLKTLGPLTTPDPDFTNTYADNAAAATFGQRLFHEKGYANALTVGDNGSNGSLGAIGDKGKVSCASCHDAAAWYIDTRTNPNNVSLGVAYTPRNAPSLVNAAFYKWYSWAGKQDSMWMQGAQGMESKENFAGNRLAYAHLIFKKYRADYDAIFPVPLDPALDPAALDSARFPASGKPKSASTDPDGPWEMMTAADRKIIETIMANCGKALEAYERLLVSKNAPLDRYVSGDYKALTPGAKRGLKLFIGKAACDGCHTGTILSDNDFHNTGVPQMVGVNVPAMDDGRFQDLSSVLKSPFNGAGVFSDDVAAGMMKLAVPAPADPDKGKFRTKGLRHVAQSGPYMHNGSFASLDQVVHFYNLGGGASGFAGTKDPKVVPLNLTSLEEQDLVEFLKTALSGEPVPAALGVDTSIP